MIDLADLKRKAEAAREAAPEEWQTISYKGKSPSGKKHQYSVCSEDFDMSGHICIGTVLVDEDGDTRLPDFVAAANPSTILDLLARLEAAEKAARPRWIACAERLPPDDVWRDYLIITREPAARIALYTFGGRFFVDSVREEAVYWHELPALPPLPEWTL